MLLIFFSFFLSFQNKIVEVTRLQDVEYLKEANNVVISELNLAARMYSDYERQFTIPVLADKPFKMNLSVNELTSYYNGLEYVNFLPINITGNILSQTFGGVNTIYRTDGIIYLPNGSIYINKNYSGFFANVNPEMCYYYNKTGDCMALYDINPVFKNYCYKYFDISCPACGNNLIEGNEECDAGNNNGVHCSVDFPGSCVFCNSQCKNETFYRNCSDNVCDIEDLDASLCSQNQTNDCVGELFMTSTPNSDLSLTENFSTLISSDACDNSNDCLWTFLNIKYFNIKGDEISNPSYNLTVSTSVLLDGDFQVNLSDPQIGACFEYSNISLEVNISKNSFYWVQSFNYPLMNCPYCGDRILKNYSEFSHYEYCDNGTSNGVSCSPTYGSSCSYCDTNCEIQTINSENYCGDGVIQTANGEECDNSSFATGGFNGVSCSPEYDLNPVLCVSCSDQCKNITESNLYCGDGIINSSFGETCDNGTTNTDNPSIPNYNEPPIVYCNSTCQTNTVYPNNRCGDNILNNDFGEECDDGGSFNGVVCNPPYDGSCFYCNDTCQLVTVVSNETCGDGVLNTDNEECDYNQDVYPSGSCVPDYGWPIHNCDFCSLSCNIETNTNGRYCGDGILDPEENGSNQCEYLDSYDSIPPDTCDPGYGDPGAICLYCSSSCTVGAINGRYCGDGNIDYSDGENCDDGIKNGVPCSPDYGTSCSYCDSSCQVVGVVGAYCGDGSVQSSEGEECDDGHANTDSCSVPIYDPQCPNVHNCCSKICTVISVNGHCCGDGKCTDLETIHSCLSDCGITPS